MRRITVTLMALAIVPCITLAQTTASQQVQSQQLTQLEDDIELQEALAQDGRDSIAILEDQMAALKTRLDSANAVVKDLKNQINALEKLKKEQEKGIKLANKTRKQTVEDRDNLVYNMEVLPVLTRQYNKLDVEQVMKKFDDMETKDVTKRKDLVNNYGKYSQEIRTMLEKFKTQFEQVRWATQGTDSELYKAFNKEFKKLGYHKTFEKGLKNADTPTIPYLDKVMNEIQLLQNSGFNNQYRYDQVINMLY